MTLSLKIEPSLLESALKAMKIALKSVDENATLSLNTDDLNAKNLTADYLSQEDKRELKEIYELAKAGKMEFLSENELSANLAKKGYEW